MFAKGIINLRKGLLVCFAILAQAWFAAPTYAQTMTISSVTPAIISSAGGNTLTVTGTNFNASLITRVFVEVGGQRSTVASYAINSPTQMTVVTSSTMGTGNGFLVIEENGGAQNAQNGGADIVASVFVAPPLTITSVTPANGDQAGGTMVQIQGGGFVDNFNQSAITAVTFGGVPAQSYQVQNDSFISAVTPAGTVGAVDVQITRAGSETATRAGGFTYLPPPPTVTGVSPAGGPTNGGTTVVITGTNFVNVTSVDFGLFAGGTTPAQSFTVNSPTQITAVTPSVGGNGHTALIEVRTASGSGSLINAFTYAPPPTVSSVNPSAGDIGGGTSVTIFGSNFVAGSTTVTFGGVAATSVTVNSPNSLTAITPAVAAGVVDVVVTTPAGSVTRAGAFTFAVVPPAPTITSVSPSSGPTTGGTLVTVTGTNFVSVQSVRFGRFGPMPVQYTVVSPTQITFTTPNSFGSTGGGFLEIQTLGGSAMLPNAFTYVAAPATPTISNVNGASGPEAGGARVSINGSNFSGTTAVTFGGVAALSFSVTSNNITAYAPPGTGTVPIVVTNAVGSTTAATQFTYTAALAPTIAGVSNSVPPPSGGRIAVYGSNLDSATSVTIGGVAASFVVEANTATSFRLEVTVPAGTAGATVPLVVTTPNGAATTNLTYLTPSQNAPSISGVNPQSVSTAGGMYVLILGSNLDGATAVTFGGVASPAFFLQGPSQLNAKVPAGSAGAVDVTVTTPGGSATRQGGLTYSAAPLPVITSATPNFGPAAGGTSVVLRGTGFTGATAVTVQGGPATYTVDSDTQITLTTSAAAIGGPTTITVSTPGGQTAVPFTYQLPGYPAPTVSAISASSGLLAGGNTVVLTGTNFVAGATVTFGGVVARNIVNSGTQITATVPAGSAGAVDVRVTTPGGASTLSNAYTYTSNVTPAPAITAVAPNTGPVAGGTSVVITGTDLTGATAVSFGGTAATSFTVDSATQITAVAPAGSAGAVSIAVTTAGGTATSNGAYTYAVPVIPAPTITAVAPNTGPVAGGTSVVITGTDLTGATAVSFGGTAATSFTVDSATQITAVAPAGSAGAVSVAVTTAGGTATSAGAYTYAVPVIPAPTITAIAPNSGPIAGGTSVVITGTNLTGATAVSFGSTAATSFTVDSATQITAVAPASAAGAVDVAVTTAGGTVTSTGGFTYNAVVAPVISTPGHAAGASTAAIAIDENLTSVTQLSADQTVTWSLDGGSDAAAFRINATSGALAFAAAPDFENPTDSDRNNTYVVRVKATNTAAMTSVQTLTVTVNNVDELGRRLAQIEGQLRTGLRSHVAHSLSDMLSFNEDLMKAANDDDCVVGRGKDLSGRASANQNGGELKMAQRLSQCGRRHQAYVDFGLNYSKQAGNWTSRMFAALRLETKVDSNLTLGAALMASQASDTIGGFASSSISDESLQVNLYGRYRISDTLRTGAFAGYGRGWYDFGLAESDGLVVDGTMTGRRQVFGWMLSGDFTVGGTVVTTDAIVSHAREKLGWAQLAARYQGESRSGIALAVGSVDTTRISVPVTAPIQLVGNDELGKSARLLLSPGVLCEDNNVQASVLRCGYQVGAKLVANDGGRNRFYADYRWESVSGTRRSLIGLGYAFRFGEEGGLELALEANRGLTGLTGQDNRAMVAIRLAQ